MTLHADARKLNWSMIGVIVALASGTILAGARKT
jgi:hypothetical protein